MRALVVCLMFLFTAQAHATESAWVRSDATEARLISEVVAVEGGTPFRLGLEMNLREGWHTYTDPPGEAGLPATLRLELPPGYTASDIGWPPAETFDESGLTTYGYTEHVVLPVTLTPPAKVQGEQLFTAHASWLVCKDICIPEHGTFTLQLPTGSAAHSAHAAAFRTPVNTPPIWHVLALALLGGLLLNVMPCVFPVLSLKALSVAKQSGRAHGHVRAEGVAYTLGILTCFAGVAGLLLALQQGGHALGWGYQMQSPWFVGAMMLLMLAIGLNLSGVYQVPTLLSSRGGGEHHWRESFMTGLLATLVATPCTVPFMAVAVGYALTQPPLTALLVFEVLGLGMALPFLLICWVPACTRLLPKPGAWMERLKRGLALPMYATALWLGWLLFMQLSPNATPATEVSYSAERLAELRAAHVPVFVDATAAWCITCQVNRKTTLEREEVQALFRARGVTFMVADWTREDPAITAFLENFGYRGVPLYVYFPPGGAPVVLPQLLTPQVVRDALGPPPL